MSRCAASARTAPAFVAQTGEAKSCVDRRAWIEAAARAARAQGCTFCRATYDTARELTLLEGWLTRPERQPEPHFQLTRGAAGVR
jgi:hypothetical protein